jgi:hypothetical protein
MRRVRGSTGSAVPEPQQPLRPQAARFVAGVHALIAERESTTSPVTVTGRAAGYLVGVTHPVDQAAFDAAQDGSVPWCLNPTEGTK